MSLESKLAERINSLLDTGANILRHQRSDSYWVEKQLIVEVQAWMTSSANLVTQITPEKSYIRTELNRIVSNENLREGAPWTLVQKLHGLLASVKEEAAHGLLRKIEDVVMATTFDDFLDHAEVFHKGNKVREAGVLASIVLEDVLKRIAITNGATVAGQSLDPLIDDLVEAGVFTPVKAKRLKGYAGIRNAALHAEWEKFDIRDAGNLVVGTRELIADYL